MTRFFKPLAGILSVEIIVGLSVPADARRGRGSDDHVYGHRSGDHHVSRNHGCRSGKIWSRKAQRCVWSRRHHHDDGQHHRRSRHH